MESQLVSQITRDSAASSEDMGCSCSLHLPHIRISHGGLISMATRDAVTLQTITTSPPSHPCLVRRWFLVTGEGSLNPL